MTELAAFVAMLERAGVGHGLRYDFDPDGVSVQVEHEDGGKTITDWLFDKGGNLIDVVVCK
jgi:hypothetical protein